MKLGVMLAAVFVAAVSMGGCASNEHQMLTLSETHGEYWNRINRNLTLTTRQIPDDIALVLMVDRPVKLSERPVPTH